METATITTWFCAVLFTHSYDTITQKHILKGPTDQGYFRNSKGSNMVSLLRHILQFPLHQRMQIDTFADKIYLKRKLLFFILFPSLLIMQCGEKEQLIYEQFGGANMRFVPRGSLDIKIVNNLYYVKLKQRFEEYYNGRNHEPFILILNKNFDELQKQEKMPLATSIREISNFTDVEKFIPFILKEWTDSTRVNQIVPLGKKQYKVVFEYFKYFNDDKKVICIAGYKTYTFVADGNWVVL